MRSQENIDRLNRNYGLFFVFLAAVSLGLAYFHFGAGQWKVALSLLAGVLFFGAIGWWAIAGPILRNESEDDGGDGLVGAGRPVPIVPMPSHHLVAAKDFPPAEKTHCLVMD